MEPTERALNNQALEEATRQVQRQAQALAQAQAQIQALTRAQAQAEAQAQAQAQAQALAAQAQAQPMQVTPTAVDAKVRQIEETLARQSKFERRTKVLEVSTNDMRSAEGRTKYDQAHDSTS